MTKPTVILGAGFAGLFAALHLCHKNYALPVVLIDQAERFVFKPLLYELLSTEMTIDQVSPLYEELLSRCNISYVQDRVMAINLEQSQVQLDSGLSYAYSNLVLALGSKANYFNIKGAAENALTFRSSDDVIRLKQHLRSRLQCASQTKDNLKRQALLTIAVIGAGPAGIEIALTLADLLPQWYARLKGDTQEIKIVIINRSPEILKGDPNSSAGKTIKQAIAQRRNLEIRSQAEVQTVFVDGIEYMQDEQLQQLNCATTVWTAGNTLNPLIQQLAIDKDYRDRRGRLKVEPTLQLPNYPEVFAAGDCACLGADLPATAQVAYQQGKAIAHNLLALSQGKPATPASIHLRGTLMKLGLGEASANMFDRFIVAGQLGHLIREGTYLELLPNSVHNFKATTQWLTDELFSHHLRVAK